VDFVYGDEIETELVRAVSFLPWPSFEFPEPVKDQIDQDYQLALRLFEEELNNPANFAENRPKRARKLTRRHSSSEEDSDSSGSESEDESSD
jgi:hypothetical protein